MRMKIVDIRPTTVTVPLEAPLRHANGCHWGRFVRTIVETAPEEAETRLSASIVRKPRWSTAALGEGLPLWCSWYR